MRRNIVYLSIVIFAAVVIWRGARLRQPPSSRVTYQRPADSPSETISNDAFEPATDEASVSLRVSGINGTGLLYVAVFESETGFPKHEQAMRTEKVTPGGHQEVIVLERLTSTTLAIAVFQDRDGNGELTKGVFGIPTEPYGFSNNARGTFGPPKFSAAAFSVDGSQATVEIQLAGRTPEDETE